MNNSKSICSFTLWPGRQFGRFNSGMGERFTAILGNSEFVRAIQYEASRINHTAAFQMAAEAYMKSVKVEFTGIRPLIMANPQTIKISNPFATEGRRLNREFKRFRRKEDDHKLFELEALQIRNDWESSAYWDKSKCMFFLPDSVLLACMREGGAASRKGKDIDRCVIITETEAYVQCKKFKSLDEAFKDPAFRLEGPCKIPPKKGNLIWKARCMIPTGWSLQFSIEFDEDTIAEKSMIEILEAAGKVGVGGWRPKFGRFLVEIL